MAKTKKATTATKTTKISLTRDVENQLKGDAPFVIGADEAGRGPLAGPVVAAACYLPSHLPLFDGIGDSKLLSEADREAAFEILTDHPEVVYGVSIVSHTEIDDINILQASLTGMARATQQLLDKLQSHSSFAQITQASTSHAPSRTKGKVVKKIKEESEFHMDVADSSDWKSSFIALIDGNRLPATFPLANLKPVIQGDRKVYSIAAASIIAKVTRDRIMVEYDKQFPIYNFAQHKGYPTAEHRSIVARYGPCEIHRKSYGPVKAALLAREKKEDSEEAVDDEKRKKRENSRKEVPSNIVEEYENDEQQQGKEKSRKRRNWEITKGEATSENRDCDEVSILSKRRKTTLSKAGSPSDVKSKKEKKSLVEKELVQGIRRSERIRTKSKPC